MRADAARHGGAGQAGRSKLDRTKRQVFLFLQGPISPFFAEMADALEARGHRCLRVNLCFGDWLFWRRPGGIDFRGSREKWPAFVADLIDREGVTDLVLLGEQRFYHKVAIAVAKARDLKVTVTDFGYLRPDWITFERDGMSGDSCFPRDPEAVMELARDVPEPDLAPRYRDSFVTQIIWDMAYHLMSNWLWWLYPGYRSHQVHHPALVYLSTALHILRAKRTGPKGDRLVESLRAAGTPYYVMPLQMENDFQLRAYSPFFDLKTPIHMVIRSFAAHAPAGSRLLIKIHPLDPNIRNWRRIVRRSAVKWNVADRVDYIDGGQLAAMLEGASGVVTVNSTVGMWAMRAGKPTMTLGAAVYDIEGLTYQGSLDRFWTEAQPPRRDLWDAFIKAIVANIQIRGVYYRREGLDAAVEAGAARLDLAQGTWLEVRSRAARRQREAPSRQPELGAIEAIQNV
ncbi:capsule biosynthesis protein [Methylobacterium nodulans]|uniref:Capsule polysaccharide biosynthesis protein n=1 Tax=Methylobacterium nodulans (strain LMG 21967 / CNCM I-2342 / ORS 2060) TaxID=460265 RepID=B8IT42_METNO|nr:capsular biosynthesis protein [Methylobacterium nodulans]ACL56928.1 Capsule polysaccharide biosynthesis protein [Methylobacterium nodulans ORS 2060]